MMKTFCLGAASTTIAFISIFFGVGCGSAAPTTTSTTAGTGAAPPVTTTAGTSSSGSARTPTAAGAGASGSGEATGVTPSTGAAGVVALSAAGSPAIAAGGAAAPAATGGITYHKDIRPLIESSCLDCHVAGGIGPFALDNWMAVKTVSASVASAVMSELMPPSYWNNACQPLHEDRALSPEKRAVFAQWKDGGYQEGIESDYVAPPPRTKKELGAPTIVMSAGVQYTPPAMADEYRCFVLKTIPDESYLTGLQIIPLQGDEVHHVIIYRVAPAQLSQAMQLDAQDSKPGYACSGGAMVQSQNMFSYRPGSEAVTFSKGDAAYMEAGSALIIQVHYNTVFLAAGKSPTPDETKVALWTLPKGELPDHVVYRTTTFGPINLPAGNANWVSDISRPMSELSTISSGGMASPFGGAAVGAFLPGEIIGMTPHAHQLAKQMNASLKRADGSMTCLDDVKWNFQWQLDYIFEKGVPYTANDTFTASCTYDNSAANQPVIDGQKQQPRDVAFGERSIDEMCEHYIWLRFERDAFMKARAGG